MSVFTFARLFSSNNCKQLHKFGVMWHFAWFFILFLSRYENVHLSKIIEYKSKKGNQTDTEDTVRLRPQIAKDDCGGQSYTQSLVNRSSNHINKQNKLQRKYNNLRLETEEKHEDNKATVVKKWLKMLFENTVSLLLLVFRSFAEVQWRGRQAHSCFQCQLDQGRGHQSLPEVTKN